MDFTEQELPVECICFSPSGNLFASGSANGTTFVYDFNPSNRETFGKVLFEFQIESTVETVDISPSEKLLTIGTFDNKVNIYSIDKSLNEKGMLLHSFSNSHSKEVKTICFSICGRFIISGGWDKNLVLHDLNSLGKIEFSEEKKENSEEKKDIVTQKFTEDDIIHSVAVNPTNEFIATGNQNGKVNIYKFNPLSTDNNFAELQMSLDAHTNSVNCVSFSPSGKYCATASTDKFVCIYDTNPNHIGETFGNLLKKFQSSFCNETGVDFSLNDEYLASCGWDEKIKLFC